jgi:hypothetical protein
MPVETTPTMPLVWQWVLPLLPVALWCVWWLCCVNWEKAWPVLARGGWIVVVLLGLVSALVWSSIFPRPMGGLPNFWWQAGAVTALILAGLLCGWLQGKLGWTPGPVDFYPKHEHGHGQPHGHH